MSRKTEDFTILIDQREKRPYSFNEYPVTVKTCHLKTGDYTIEGYENEFTVERKDKRDIYLSLTHERERFKREWSRMNNYEYAAVIIEDSSFLSLLTPPEGNHTNPKAIVQSLISWQIRFPRVHVFTIDNRNLSECLIFSLCEKFLYNRKKKNAEILQEINRLKSEEMGVT